MMKLRSKILAGMSVVAVAGAVAATGLTVASASQAAGRSRIEYFQILATSNATSSIIARGVFTAGGVNHPGNRVDTAVFSNGTFKIAHSNGTGTQHFNKKTCLGTLVLNGTYRLGSGTGAYAGISGHGIYRLNITFVTSRTSAGGCSSKPVAFQQIIKAQGPASL